MKLNKDIKAINVRIIVPSDFIHIDIYNKI